MLVYLAEKTGKFLPSDFYGRYDAIQWTFWQMGGLGPMAGQNHHFRNYAVEKIKYAIDRYVNETNRLYGVLNKRLADREFVAGDYSIADMSSRTALTFHFAVTWHPRAVRRVCAGNPGRDNRCCRWASAGGTSRRNTSTHPTGCN